MYISDEQRLILVRAEIAKLPATFGLRAYPGHVFRVSEHDSYINDFGVMMLYTEINDCGKWKSFAKGTAVELKAEITYLT